MPLSSLKLSGLGVWAVAGLQLVLTLAALFALQGCSTTKQPLDLTSPVKLRTADARQELEAAAAKSLSLWAVPFARVSSVVRCRDLDSSDPRLAKEEGCDTLPPLADTHWVKLYDWRDVLNPEELNSGLQFAAYGRERPGEAKGEIIIGFRGTRSWNWPDMRANLRWVTRLLPLPGQDHYQVVHRHAKHLVSLAEEKARQKFGANQAFSIYTTGHSLGGGLAQLLAYSDHRIIAAVVFDPSPVTGYSNLVKDAAVNCSARVARIYERGEGLSYLRTFLRYFYGLSENIEEVSFDFIHTGGNPVANHSMTDLRQGLELRADVDPRVAVAITNAELPDKPDCSCFTMRKPVLEPASVQEREAQVCANPQAATQ